MRQARHISPVPPSVLGLGPDEPRLAAPVRFREPIGVLIGGGPKRALDVLLSACLLLLLLPLMGMLALVVKLESRGSVFYRCSRVGTRFRPLEVLKFRKMVDGSRGPALTAADDPRFTRCGRWLAATKLDELPQLWNVLKGEMSLVGPRPEDAEFVAMHKPEYEIILAARPGITGLSQLAFAREAAILDSQDRVAGYVDRLLPAKVQIDLFYVQRRDLAMDIRILAWTALAVLLRLDVAVHRQSGRLSLRRRPVKRRSVQEQSASDLGLGSHAAETLADRRAGQPATTAVRK
jgi:lipopolysaccharide/colanic/teichoic acid biosynthesis glycosyltransferase